MWQQPFQARDEDERQARLDSQDFDDVRRWRWVFAGGVAALITFGVCAVEGLPGAGIVLVPLGLGMIIGAGIQLLLYR